MFALVVGLAVVVLVLIFSLAVLGTWAVLAVRELRALVRGQRSDFDALGRTLNVKDLLVNGIEQRLSRFQDEAMQRIMHATNHAAVIDDRLKFHEQTVLPLQASRRKYEKRIAEMQAEHKAKVDAAKQAATPAPAAPAVEESEDAAQEGVGQAEVVGSIGTAEASA